MKRLLAITFAACGGKGVPFPSGNLGRAKATLGADSSYRSVLEGRALPGLVEYLDTTRMPAACAAYVEAASERFYDAGLNGRNVRPHGHPETQTKPITKTT